MASGGKTGACVGFLGLFMLCNSGKHNVITAPPFWCLSWVTLCITHTWKKSGLTKFYHIRSAVDRVRITCMEKIECLQMCGNALGTLNWLEAWACAVHWWCIAKLYPFPICETHPPRIYALSCPEMSMDWSAACSGPCLPVYYYLLCLWNTRPRALDGQSFRHLCTSGRVLLSLWEPYRCRCEACAG